MFWHNHHKGEIATTLTLVTILVLTVGIFAGTQLSQQNTDTRSRAASSSGDGFLVCDSGSDPYNSNTIVVTNKTSQTISNIQSVSFSCKYEPGRIRKGFYKCETCTDSDEVGNPDCQVGIHDPLRSAEFTLAPGDTKTITVNANACEIVQFDVYNPIDQGESPTECYNIGSNYINPGPPNWWPGGIGFGINENASCSSGGYVPPGSVPTPTPTSAVATPTPTIDASCTGSLLKGYCESQSSCSEPDHVFLGQQGQYQCSSNQRCCVPRYQSSTPTPVRTSTPASTPTRTPTPRPTFTLVPEISSYQLSCSNIQVNLVFNDVSGNQMVIITIPQPHRLAGTYIVPVQGTVNKTFKFGQIWLDNVVECSIPF